jgi:hypothetical protein
LDAGSDLNTVTINGAGGADLLLLDLAGGEFINNAVSDGERRLGEREPQRRRRDQQPRRG